jgi:hypothetical protein
MDRGVALVALIAACGGHAASGQAPALRPVQPSGTPSASTTTPTVRGDAPPDPRLEALLDERDRLLDWRSAIFATAPPNPPDPNRGRLPQRSGAFPLSRAATVRAYVVQAPLSDGDDPGTSTMPFTRDRRLDESFVPPDAELAADERARISELVTHAGGDIPRISACDFEAHHMLVFFGADGMVLAKIFLCFGCHEWITVPPVTRSGRRPQGMTPGEHDVFTEILEAHHLGAWVFDEDSPVRREVLAYEQRRYGTREAPTTAGREREARWRNRPSGVPRELFATRATPHDRALLCSWFSEQARLRGDSLGRGYRCENGATYSTDRDTCSKAIACDVPMGRIEACLRNFADPTVICTSGPGAECAGLRGCIPAVVWKEGPW